MKNKHILEILDEKSLTELTAEESALISSHSADCAACEQAVRAARVSSLLLKFQAGNSAAAEPSPFFQAKVMNAIRANQSLRRPMAAFRRWWQASYAMVCLMLFTVIGLIALTMLAPSSASEETQAVVPNNLYTTDAVILNQRSTREMTNEQVFQVIYNPRYEAGKK